MIGRLALLDLRVRLLLPPPASPPSSEKDRSSASTKRPTMAPSPLSHLPPEILHQILTYLPISTLLTFARVSKQHYSASILALNILQLAILPRRVHGTLAFLDSSNWEDIDFNTGDIDYNHLTQNQIVVTSPLQVPRNGSKKHNGKASKPPSTPAQYREQLFNLQNALAYSILSSRSLVNLQSLTLHIYHVTSPALTEILASHFPNLKTLRLNFSHPYLHDTCLPAQYWTSPVFLEGSPVWNAVAGIGEDHEARLRLRKLQRLTVERAGITSVQLRKWVESNPRLRELKLRNVAGVDAEFVQWLGQYHGASRDGKRTPRVAGPVKLTSLALEHCSSLSIKSIEELEWLDPLFADRSAGNLGEESHSALENLSLLGSKALSTPSLLRYLDTRRPPVRQVTLPDGRVLVAKPSTSPRTRRHNPGSSTEASGSQDLERRISVMRMGSTQSLDDSISRNSDAFNDKLDSEPQASDGEDDEQESPVSYLHTLPDYSSWRGLEYRPGGETLIEPDTGIR